MRRNFLSAVMLNATAALGADVLLTACGEVGPGPSNTPPTSAFTADCQWLTCAFVDSSTDADGRVEAWAWDFGDSTSSTEQDPTHVYAKSGQFTVTLRVTDDSGAQAVTSQQVSVNQDTTIQHNTPPTADFEVVCPGLACGFTDRSTDPDSGGSIVSHAWDFGDGGTSDQPDPFHIYESPGEFTVTLTVTDNEGARGVAERQISVAPGLLPDRSGTYERETPHAAPDHHSRYLIRGDSTFELHDLNGSDSTVYTGRWKFASSYGGWPLEGGEVILFDFDDFEGDQYCGEAFGVFLMDDYMGVAYCGTMSRAGFEEGVYTATPGSYLLPSPEAGQIAFVRAGRIYLANTDGSGVTPLSDGPEDSLPAWSPDGQRLAFTREAGPTPFGAPDRTIFIMDADGSNIRQRTTMRAAEAPAWSPDGQWIAFAAFTPYDSLTPGTGSMDIFVMRAEDDGTSPINITSGRVGQEFQPAWSPDGSRIAFVSDWALSDVWFDIWVVAPDGSQPIALRTHTPIMPNPYDQHQPAWSANGQALAYEECPWAWYRCSSGVIGVMNADGSVPTRLVVTSGFAHPTWSPDGQVIAFASPNGIEWVNADGSARGLIISDGHSPAWRPHR